MFRQDVSDATAPHLTYADRIRSDENAFIPVPIPADILQTGENTIAVSVHQDSGSSSDISFDLTVSDRATLFVADVFEWNATWESGELPSYQENITIPAAATRTGATYQARVRHRDDTGRWSHWSAPIRFIAGQPDTSNLENSLVISEVMYHPADLTQAERDAGFVDPDQFEFVEIRNVSDSTIDLRDVRFTKGVDFDFVDSLVTTLAPNEFAVVVRDEVAFLARYGFGHPIAGTFSGKLSNSDDRVKLSFGAGETLQDFTYFDTPPWPTAPDGDGYSLTLINPRSLPDHNDPFSWRQSSFLGGLPGGIDGDTYQGSTLQELQVYAFNNEASTLSKDSDKVEFQVIARLDSDNIYYKISASEDLINWTVPTDFLSRTDQTALEDGFGLITYSGSVPAAYDKLYIRYEVIEE